MFYLHSQDKSHKQSENSLSPNEKSDVFSLPEFYKF